ncbi:integrase core domain-containing protein, partial [Streptomyces sp. NPDC057909]|uniref:integrase core domain-containing protein n=1 Tax=Streptomyces sp. NPDC057909 TaxID=3346277 RepID=UPI0036E35FA8
VAFTTALHAEGLGHLIERRLNRELRQAGPPPDEEPVLLAVSDNGPQMTSADTRAFMAACLIAQHFGRPHTPNDQAWIESLFGHVKGEWPHLEKIRDPFELEAELDVVREQYNTVRLHAGIGYVTPDDEHSGRADAIRTARQTGLQQAQADRIAYRRTQRATTLQS